jgi:hypothetical protein
MSHTTSSPWLLLTQEGVLQLTLPKVAGHHKQPNCAGEMALTTCSPLAPLKCLSPQASSHLSKLRLLNISTSMQLSHHDGEYSSKSPRTCSHLLTPTAPLSPHLHHLNTTQLVPRHLLLFTRLLDSVIIKLSGAYILL